MSIHQHAIDPDHEIFSHWVSHAQAQQAAHEAIVAFMG